MLVSIFQTVEFYIIAAFIAAAVVAAAALPSRRGAARTFLFGGELSEHLPTGGSEIIFTVEDNGNVSVVRTGFEGMTESGAYSLAVTIIGFDATIEERLMPGKISDAPVNTGYATMNCFGRERYHFQYKSEVTGRSAAFSLNIRPGNTISRPLS